MVQKKSVLKVLFSLFALIAFSNLGALESTQNASILDQNHMTKKYVSSDSIFF